MNLITSHIECGLPVAVAVAVYPPLAKPRVLGFSTERAASVFIDAMLADPAMKYTQVFRLPDAALRVQQHVEKGAVCTCYYDQHSCPTHGSLAVHGHA